MSIEFSRRCWLKRMGGGFGSLALVSLLHDQESAVAQSPGDAPGPLAPRAPHFPPRAKRVIFLFMPGGPSQVDTFDPKPRLTQDSGRPAPKLVFSKNVVGDRGMLLGSPWKFRPYGQSGLEVS